MPQTDEGVKKWLDELEKHPLTAKLREDLAAKEMAERKDAAAKIEALEKARDNKMPKLRAVLDEKENNLKKAQAALNNATGEFNAAKYNLTSEAHNYETAINDCAMVLIGSADPAINAAIVYFQNKLSWLRSPGRISRNAAGSEQNIFTKTKIVKEETNAPAVKSALIYCMAAIKDLETMKILPSPDLQKIEDMKKGIPDIAIYTEYQGEKPLS